MSSTAQPLPVLVVGGGIGGMAAALAIARRGRPVRVVERDVVFRELGAGIQLSANATRVLAELDVLPAVRRRSVLPHDIVMLDAESGQRLTALRLGAGYRAHFGHPYLVVHRGDLLDALLRRCRDTRSISLETGREVRAVVSHDEHAEVEFADGERCRAVAVVGADGVRSTVRRSVTDARPAATGFVTYRGTVPVTSDVPAAVRVWIAPDRHLVSYPISSGHVHNIAAVFRADGHGNGPDALDLAFANSCPQVRDAVALVSRDRHWDVCELDPLPRWGHGRVTLLGDAAHAMVQYLAQGACQALEDAAVLGSVLGAATDAATDAALRRYEYLRYPRVTRVGRAATVWGQLWHTADPVTRGLRDRVFALRGDDDYGEAEWLHGFAASDAATPSSAHRTVYS